MLGHTTRISSAVALVCLLGLTLFNGRGFRAPISLDLHDRNPFAWLLLISVAAVIVLLSVHLWARGHSIRPALLILAFPALLVVALTSPFSLIHGVVFQFLYIGSLLWFVFCTADVLEDFVAGVLFVVVSLIGLVIVAPVFDLGGMQKILIGYALVCTCLIQRRVGSALK